MTLTCLSHALKTLPKWPSFCDAVTTPQGDAARLDLFGRRLARVPPSQSPRFRRIIKPLSNGLSMNDQLLPAPPLRSRLLRLAERLLRSALKPSILAPTALSVWLVAIFVVAAISLPLPQIGFAQDVGVMLDAGWRYFQGLRTHADYHSPLGPLFAIIFGLPMKIGGPTYSSFKLLPPVVTALFAAWTIVVTSASLQPLTRACLAAGIASAAGGLFHLGFPVEALSFAVFYNRVGFALLCVIGLSALLPRTTPLLPAWVSPVRDASMAIASVMLLFLKVNFFAAAMPFWIASAVLHRRTRTDVVAFGLGIAGSCLFFLHEIGYRLDRMVFDLAMAADARRACLDSFFFPLRNAIANHDAAILLALCTVACWSALRASNASSMAVARTAAIVWGPALLGFALTLMQSHGDGRGIPLVLVGMAAGIAWITPPSIVKDGSGEDETIQPGSNPLVSQAVMIGSACLVCTAALFILPHAYSYVHLAHVSRNAGPRQFRGPGIRDLYIGAFGNNLEPGAIPKMNDGLALLSRHTMPGDSLQYMDMNNIYTFASHLRSPKQSMLFWDNRSSYTEAKHPPESDFVDSDFIMAPKPQLTPSPLETEWWKIYAYTIEEHYDLVEETDFFRLWRRSRRESSKP